MSGRLLTMVGILGLWLLTPGAWGAEFVADQWTQVGEHIYRASLFCREDMWRI